MATTWLFIREYINFNMKTFRLPGWMGEWARAGARGQGSSPALGDPGGGQTWQRAALGTPHIQGQGKGNRTPIQCQEG